MHTPHLQLGAIEDEGWSFGGNANSATTSTARRVLWRSLVRDAGRQGTLLEGPHSESFETRVAFNAAQAHAPHRLLGPLPGGDVTTHDADLALGWEGGQWLYVDIIYEADGIETLKAAAFDAIHLRQLDPGCHPVLVMIRQRGGMDRETIESLAYPYKFLYGMHAEDTEDEQGFTALRHHILAWLSDAGATAPSPRGLARTGRA